MSLSHLLNLLFPLFNNPIPVVFPCQNQLLGSVHAAGSCFVSVAMGEDSSMELPGEAQPGNAEVTCWNYPVPGQHPVPCTNCSSPTKQEFLGLKCARELTYVDLHTSEQVTTSSTGH